MNYNAHYQMLVLRAKMRELSGYVERHHVVPKCIGGTNDKDNIVALTAGEHYVAHQLLVKMYPLVYGLAVAATRMSRQCTGSKAYGWLRHRLALTQKNKVISIETRRRISEATKAAMNTPAMQAQMSFSRRGRPLTPLHRAKMSLARKGRKRDPAAVAKTVRANTGRKRSQVACERMRASRLAYLERSGA